ncbi:ATP-binding protein [Cryobacterium sp. Y11]|uniref:ATP-binding protein n=1 Tax=Cryobacterium sp. Y11 TaxID=2045016 RepID=UPI001E44B1B0|nr:ATP-binding protein [Cryobacterium sp. Y11]
MSRVQFSFTLLMIDEEFLVEPDESTQSTQSTQSMLLELSGRRYDESSTVFCTQYARKHRHQQLGSSIHAGAIMDQVVHHGIWVETGSYNMRANAAQRAV